jgi:hypothetical protein
METQTYELAAAIRYHLNKAPYPPSITVVMLKRALEEILKLKNENDALRLQIRQEFPQLPADTVIDAVNQPRTRDDDCFRYPWE